MATTAPGEKKQDSPKGKNPNRPKKGSVLTVEPIRSTRDIESLKKLLHDNPRDYALFVIGINTALRASDLLSIQIEQVMNLEPGDSLELRERKTGKKRSIVINKAVFDAIQYLLVHRRHEFGDLFASQRGGKAITKQRLNRLVKEWAGAINLKGNYGCHTLRKTFGYIHRTKFNTDIPTLMRMYNHSTQRQTLTYLCIQEQDVNDAYLKEI